MTLVHESAFREARELQPGDANIRNQLNRVAQVFTFPCPVHFTALTHEFVRGGSLSQGKSDGAMDGCNAPHESIITHCLVTRWNSKTKSANVLQVPQK